MRCTGIEPVAHAWEAYMLPLHQQRAFSPYRNRAGATSIYIRAAHFVPFAMFRSGPTGMRCISSTFGTL